MNENIRLKVNTMSKTKELEQAASRLWNVFDGLLSVYENLEDEEGNLSPKEMVSRYGKAISALQDLLFYVQMLVRAEKLNRRKVASS